MNVSSKKHEFLNNLIVLSILVYLFFLSRRGGDTKDAISTFIMFLIFVYSLKNSIKRYLTHRYNSRAFISNISYNFLYTC